MKIKVQHKEINYSCDLSKPLDISIPAGQVKCFYAPDIKVSPVVSGDFVGDVNAGSPVNFYNVALNPHGNGTHTESLGHITPEQESVNRCLLQFHFITQLISVELTKIDNGDNIISKEELLKVCPDELPEALVIRTLPNDDTKLKTDYSGTNPPYLSKGAMEFIVGNNVKHLLLDLPSVDKEEDEGKVENHKLFWNILSNNLKEHTKHHQTITELIYVPDYIKDGKYLLNIQIPSIDLDAVPSKPVLYQLIREF